MITDTEENRAKLRRAGELLLGTSNSVDDALREAFDDDDVSQDDFTPEMLLELDDVARCCEVCSNWVESGFINDEGVCDDCADA